MKNKNVLRLLNTTAIASGYADCDLQEGIVIEALVSLSKLLTPVKTFFSLF